MGKCFITFFFKKSYYNLNSQNFKEGILLKVDESKINRESSRMLDITGFVEEANGSNNNPRISI